MLIIFQALDILEICHLFFLNDKTLISSKVKNYDLCHIL